MNTNPHRRYLLCILFALPHVACSNSTKSGGRAVDAALPDTATTAGQGDTLPPGVIEMEKRYFGKLSFRADTGVHTNSSR